MGKQMTEMLKGTLEGIVLAILPHVRPTDTRSRESRAQGFTDIAEGTVYALLIRIENRVWSTWRRSRPRRGRHARSTRSTLRAASIEEFWNTWRFLAEQLERLHQGAGRA